MRLLFLSALFPPSALRNAQRVWGLGSGACSFKLLPERKALAAKKQFSWRSGGLRSLRARMYRHEDLAFSGIYRLEVPTLVGSLNGSGQNSRLLGFEGTESRPQALAVHCYCCTSSGLLFKDLRLSYHKSDVLSFCTCPSCGSLSEVPQQQPSCSSLTFKAQQPNLSLKQAQRLQRPKPQSFVETIPSASKAEAQTPQT